jgi:hypothetical protein
MERASPVPELFSVEPFEQDWSNSERRSFYVRLQSCAPIVSIYPKPSYHSAPAALICPNNSHSVYMGVF